MLRLSCSHREPGALKAAGVGDTWSGTKVEKRLWPPQLWALAQGAALAAATGAVRDAASKYWLSANQAAPAVGLLGLNRIGHRWCLLSRAGGTCPRIACWTQTTFLLRVLLHIVSKCHEEGLDHYLRSFIKVSHGTPLCKTPCWDHARCWRCSSCLSTSFELRNPVSHRRRWPMKSWSFPWPPSWSSRQIF